LGIEKIFELILGFLVLAAAAIILIPYSNAASQICEDGCPNSVVRGDSCYYDIAGCETETDNNECRIQAYSCDWQNDGEEYRYISQCNYRYEDIGRPDCGAGELYCQDGTAYKGGTATCTSNGWQCTGAEQLKTCNGRETEERFDQCIETTARYDIYEKEQQCGVAQNPENVPDGVDLAKCLDGEWRDTGRNEEYDAGHPKADRCSECEDCEDETRWKLQSCNADGTGYFIEQIKEADCSTGTCEVDEEWQTNTWFLTPITKIEEDDRCKDCDEPTTRQGSFKRCGGPDNEVAVYVKEERDFESSRNECEYSNWEDRGGEIRKENDPENKCPPEGQCSGLSITVDVEDADSGESLNADVDLSGEQTDSGSTGDDGEITFNGLSTGNYDLSADKSGYSQESASVSLADCESEEKTLTLSTTESTPEDPDPQDASIAVDVKDAVSGEFLDANVVLTNEAGDTSSDDTGSDGEVSFSGLSAGDYDMSADKSGYSSASDSISLSEGQSNDVILELSPNNPPEGGSITARVEDGSGGILDANVVLTNEDGDTSSNYTSPDGEVSFSGLSAGDYGLSADKSGYSSAFDSVSLAEGESKDVTLTLSSTDSSPPEASITVVVENESDQRLDANVDLNGPEDKSGDTQNDGEIVFSGLPTGDYNVEASKQGYNDESIFVRLVAGDSKTENLILSTSSTDPPPPEEDDPCSDAPECSGRSEGYKFCSNLHSKKCSDTDGDNCLEVVYQENCTADPDGSCSYDDVCDDSDTYQTYTPTCSGGSCGQDTDTRYCSRRVKPYVRFSMSQSGDSIVFDASSSSDPECEMGGPTDKCR
jgi:hypothetical protein